MENSYGMKSSPARPKQESGPLLLRGAMAGLATGVVTAVGWCFLTLATNAEFGIAAWGLGIAIGFATLWGSKQGGIVPGIIAGLIALGAILGGKYMVAREVVRQGVSEAIAKYYEGNVAFARKVCAADTDDEKRQILAKINQKEDEPLKPEAVTQDEIDAYDAKVKPEHEPLATGKMSKEQWTSEHTAKVLKEISPPLFGGARDQLFTALWLILGIGSAVRIAAGFSKS